ncbi:hypothetical protein Tco_1083352 [Tanacetum coccineum]
MRTWNRLMNMDWKEMVLEMASGHDLNENEKVYKKIGRRIRVLNQGNSMDNRGGVHGILGPRMGAELEKRRNSKALVKMIGEGVDWTNHLEEDEDYALMACNSSESDT